MNWKQLETTQNAGSYVLPTGWTSCDDVAKQLGCPPGRVQSRLRPSIQNGNVEVRKFPVWDKKERKVVKTLALRVLGDGRAKTTTEEQVKEIVRLKKLGKTWREISISLGISYDMARDRFRKSRFKKHGNK